MRLEVDRSYWGNYQDREDVDSRFTLPKACVSFNGQGEPVLGLPQRPCLRVLRYDFEKAKGRENVESSDRCQRRPAGRRHDVQWQYNSHLEQDDEQHGDAATIARCVARCRRTAVLQTSRDNPLHHLCAGPSRAPSRKPSPPRPMTAPQRQGSLRSRQQDLASSLTWGAVDYHGQDPRHAAHSEFETHHLLSEAAANARQQEVRSEAATAREAVRAAVPEEARLSADYPHGLPAWKAREARQKGLRVRSLGYGTEGGVGTKPGLDLRRTSKPHAPWHYNLY